MGARRAHFLASARLEKLSALHGSERQRNQANYTSSQGSALTEVLGRVCASQIALQLRSRIIGWPQAAVAWSGHWIQRHQARSNQGDQRHVQPPEVRDDAVRTRGDCRWDRAG